MVLILFIFSFFILPSKAMEDESNLFSTQPVELKYLWMDYLDEDDLYQLSLVCHDFNHLIHDERYMRIRALKEGMIHPHHTFNPESQAVRKLSYYKLFSAHHRWMVHQREKQEIDPLFYINLTMGNEHALSLFYPYFCHHLIGCFFQTPPSILFDRLCVEFEKSVTFYANQGSHRAQNSLIFSYLLMILLLRDEENPITINLKIPRLLPLIKKFAQDGNPFLQVLLCDIYMNTQMLAGFPDYKIFPVGKISIPDHRFYKTTLMQNVFAPGKINTIILPGKLDDMRMAMGIKYGIDFASRGNTHLQKNLAQLFFKGKFGYKSDKETGELFLKHIFEKCDNLLLTPLLLLDIIPRDATTSYQALIRYKVKKEAKEGHKGAQHLLVKSLANGKNYFPKSPDQAKEYAKLFQLTPKINKKLKREPAPYLPKIENRNPLSLE